jgi:hypothetical protein
MGTYRKKGPTVEARRFRVDTDNGIQLAEWCDGRFLGLITSENHRYFIEVPCGTYKSHARPGDWIILDEGSYSVMSDEVFQLLYDKVDDIG